MATRKTKNKKVTKRESISKKYSERIKRGKETQFFEWLREKIRYHCHDPALTKAQQSDRRQKLVAHLGIKESTLKGQYLYGQNKEGIYKAALYIGVVSERHLIQFLESYPATVDDLDSFQPWLKEFYTDFKKLNSKEKRASGISSKKSS